MDRSLAYTQEQGRSTDFLFAQRATMIGLGQLAQAMLGSRTLVFGLGVTPTAPASLSVEVGAGQIYSVQPVDATAYGVLPADTTDQIIKQGIALQSQSLALTAPSTTGYSINYLIEATYEDQDTNPAVLPYFNSANPTQPLSGQNNSGAAQPTQRQGVLVLTLKAGAAAPTGSQTTPAPDSGYVGVAVVTVANGQTQITSGNITQLAGGSLFANLLQAMQGATAITAPDTGAVNALAITLSPAPTALTPGMTVAVDNIVAANTGPTTLNVNGLGALPIGFPGLGALQGAELVAGFGALLRLNHAGTAWVLLASTGAEVGPTPAIGDNSTRLATTQHFQNGMLGSASQAWTDMTGSRTFNAVYTNSTSRPIEIKVQALSTAGTTSVGINVGGAAGVSYVGANYTGAAMETSAIVQPGETYEATATGANLSKWWELR